MQNFGRENFDNSTYIRQNLSDFSTVKVLRYTVSCSQEDRVSLASYNELEQLHMQVLLNCHLATFLEF